MSGIKWSCPRVCENGLLWHKRKQPVWSISLLPEHLCFLQYGTGLQVSPVLALTLFFFLLHISYCWKLTCLSFAVFTCATGLVQTTAPQASPNKEKWDVSTLAWLVDLHRSLNDRVPMWQYLSCSGPQGANVGWFENRLVVQHTYSLVKNEQWTCTYRSCPS